VGNLHDFNPATDAVPYDQLPLTDKYVLAALSDLSAEVQGAYESYQFFKVYQAVTKFAVTDLSNFYLDTAKDRLYIQGKDSAERRSCQTVMQALLEALAVLISPLTPHMAEDVWQALPYPHPAGSIFQAAGTSPAARGRGCPPRSASRWRRCCWYGTWRTRRARRRAATP